MHPLVLFMGSVSMTWALVRFGPIYDTIADEILAHRARKACPMCQGVLPALVCTPDSQREFLCGAHLGHLMRIERLERALKLTS